MVAPTVKVLYKIERHNGRHWEGGYGQYGFLGTALLRYDEWLVEQPTSAWRVIANTETDAVLKQYEPE